MKDEKEEESASDSSFILHPSSFALTGTDVKTGYGGIRDVEFTIQFLQLLNGGDLPELRQRNTLLAMQALERAGCLTNLEYHLLEDGYRFLRKTEHRLQLLFDLQTHRLPTGEDELRKLALRMGYSDGKDEGRRMKDEKEEEKPSLARSVSEVGLTLANASGQCDSSFILHPSSFILHPSSSALDAFLRDYREKTDRNHKILNHLLHQTFVGEEGQAEPESDLILDLHPEPETVRTVLGRYGFRDVQGAYHSLTQLAQESVQFLSARRCRHFLANIAHQLLQALAETPDPDMALVNLEKVTASLGAKAVLWELFSFNPPSLRLYVDLCAGSQFLSEILINNPGMIDDLLDSLVLNQPRTAEELRTELTELCRGAADIEPILHSFRDKELLRIGVRDILGKDTIRETTAALSDLAETILVQIARAQYPPLEKRFGVPYLDAGGGNGGQGDKVTRRQGDKETNTQADGGTHPVTLSPCHPVTLSPCLASVPRASRYVILGLGKLGGHELSYHSDLDLIIVYEGDGRTGPPPGSTRFDRFELTDNFHFFTELGQRIIKVTSVLGPMGRLYQVDMRLRPTGKSGSLVIPLAEFRRYYEEGGAQLWERQALTRARLVHGDAEFGREVMAVVEQGAFGLTWRPEVADEIRNMRKRLEASRSERDLKRGFGGIVDVEFLVQLLQLKYGPETPALRATNTWAALDAWRRRAC